MCLRHCGKARMASLNAARTAPQYGAPPPGAELSGATASVTDANLGSSRDSYNARSVYVETAAFHSGRNNTTARARSVELAGAWEFHKSFTTSITWR